MFAGLILMVIAIVYDLRRTPKQEAKMIERQDKTMAEIKDDPPNWPARFLP
jgi:hypothetical protein